MLIVLTAIPLITLSAYLFLAIRIFEADKIAYVFDTTSAVSGSVSAQVRSNLNAVLLNSKTIIQDYLNLHKFGEVSQAVFSGQPDLQSLLVYSYNPNGTTKYSELAYVEKEPGGAQRLRELMVNQSTLLSQLESKNRIVKAPYNDERILLCEKVGDFAFVIQAKVTGLLDILQAPGSYKIYLHNEAGEILIGPDESSQKTLRDILSSSLVEKISSSKAQASTQDGTDVDGNPILVSFARAGFSDLTVTSVVKKTAALKATSTLIRRSLIFFGILLCATILVSLVASGTITSALSQLFYATRQVAEGHFDVRVDVRSSDEVGSLAENFNLMSAEVSRLMVETAEKARMEGELKTAQTVQETLFPPSFSKFHDLEIAGYYEPASECGGDWWHYCQVGDKIFLWIGDATGHGAPAALITSAARAVSTIVEKLRVNPGQALSLLNRAIYDVSKGKIMMTFFVASYDPKTGEFSYANASHDPPFLIRAGEGPIKKKNLEPLNEVNSARLGQDRDSVFQQITLMLNPGDSVFFYTDGVQDVRTPQGEALGEREFLKLIVEAHRDRPKPQAVIARMSGVLREKRKGSALIDDVTFFEIKREEKV